MTETEIPAEPITFIDSVVELMISHGELEQGFAVSETAKKAFAATLARWTTVEGKITQEQINQTTRNVKSFVTGYWYGKKHKFVSNI